MPRPVKGIYAARRKSLKQTDRILVNARVPTYELTYADANLLNALEFSRRDWVETLLVGLWCTGPLATSDGPYAASRALQWAGIDLKHAMDMARAPKFQNEQELYEQQKLITGKRPKKLRADYSYAGVSWIKSFYDTIAMSLEDSGFKTPSHLIAAVWFWSQAENREVPYTLACQLAVTCEYWQRLVNGWPYIRDTLQGKQRRMFEQQNRENLEPILKCTPHSLIDPKCIPLPEDALPWVLQKTLYGGF